MFLHPPQSHCYGGWAHRASWRRHVNRVTILTDRIVKPPRAPPPSAVPLLRRTGGRGILAKESKTMPVHIIRGGYATTYLIEDEDSLVAVDVGTASAAKKIHHYLSDRSIDASSLRAVTATHFHIDHVAGISKLVDLFPEIRVCFLTMVGAYLKGNEKICLFAPSLWLKGLLPVLVALDEHLKHATASLVSEKVAIPLPLLRTLLPSAYKAECILDEGKDIPFLPHWELLRTPGHTHDSVCFYNRNEKTLISGDTILNMKGGGELNKFCCDPSVVKESFEKLLPLSIRSVYPGHGRPLLNLDGLASIIH